MDTPIANAEQDSCQELEPNISDDLREKYIFSYFSRTNLLNKHILTQQKSLSKYLGERWNDLPRDRQDLLADFLFVDDEVRNQHTCASNIFALNHLSSENEMKESFPRLFINSGQKINVDFESDLWTWRDEHSGPFSWYSKSQQDLTLSDLEPDNITKPQPKTSRADTDDEESVKKCESQFTYPSSCWCHDVIGEYRKHERDISVSPSNSINFSTVAKVEACPEEVNPAFEGSEENLPKVSDDIKSNEQEVLPSSSRREPETNERKSRHKNRSRSPSPKKILRPGSLKRSPSKDGDEKLINKDDTDTDSNNAFSNPAMESEWSTFVGEETCEANRSHQVKPPITSAPEPINMDRGCDIPNDSPYRGDQDFLIQPLDSPAVHSVAAAPCPPSLSQSSSEETTPDHTTHLLKGMQSPVHVAHKLQYLRENSLAISPAESAETGIEIKNETDEVLRVEKEGDKFFFKTEVEVENKRDSDIPMSGFDFLDNW